MGLSRDMLFPILEKSKLQRQWKIKCLLGVLKVKQALKLPAKSLNPKPETLYNLL